MPKTEVAEVPSCEPEEGRHYFPDGKTCPCGEAAPVRPAIDPERVTED